MKRVAPVVEVRSQFIEGNEVPVRCVIFFPVCDLRGAVDDLEFASQVVFDSYFVRGSNCCGVHFVGRLVQLAYFVRDPRSIEAAR